MTPQARRRSALVVAWLGAVVFLGGAQPARAQWGMGYGGGGFGLGWGWGMFSPVPKPESYLYQNALVGAGRNVERPTRDAYANNPNSYINHLRDNGIVPHYSATRREPAHYRYPGPPRPAGVGARAVSPASLIAEASQAMPLASFSNPEGRIGWPADAPTAGDLAEKRAACEQAAQAVMNEVKKNGVASMASVTEARQKLLEYGRPALHHVRTHETPRVADSFHLFLLSLYEALAHATNPVVTAAAPVPANPL